MKFHRIKELSEAYQDDPKSYFYKFWDEFGDDPLKVSAYERLENELQVLDTNAWNQLKIEAEKLCIFSHKNRGWSQLFEKLNEAKGYKYLKESNYTKIEFIPRSEKGGVETPDLKALSNQTLVLCEVKTIQESDALIEARKNIEVRNVENTLNKPMIEKLEGIFKKAESQLNSYSADKNAIKIIYLVIHFDDGCYYGSGLNKEVYEFFNSMNMENISCVIYEPNK